MSFSPGSGNRQRAPNASTSRFGRFVLVLKSRVSRTRRIPARLSPRMPVAFGNCLGSVGGSSAIRQRRVKARSIHSRGQLKFPGKSLDFPSSNHQFMLEVSDPAQQCGTRTTTRHGLLTLCPMKTNFVSLLKRLEGLNSCCCSIFLMSRLSSQHSNKAVHN